jgi:hypothetical protein
MSAIHPRLLDVGPVQCGAAPIDYQPQEQIRLLEGNPSKDGYISTDIGSVSVEDSRQFGIIPLERTLASSAIVVSPVSTGPSKPKL